MTFDFSKYQIINIKTLLLINLYKRDESMLILKIIQCTIKHSSIATNFNTSINTFKLLQFIVLNFHVCNYIYTNCCLIQIINNTNALIININ